MPCRIINCVISAGSISTVNFLLPCVGFVQKVGKFVPEKAFESLPTIPCDMQLFCSFQEDEKFPLPQSIREVCTRSGNPRKALNS